MKVIVQLKSSPAATMAAAKNAGSAMALLENLQPVSERTRPRPRAIRPVQLPERAGRPPVPSSARWRNRSTFSVDGEGVDLPRARQRSPTAARRPRRSRPPWRTQDVVGVYSDPGDRIVHHVRHDAKAVGTLLPRSPPDSSVAKLAAKQMTGKGVFLAIVDTGINLPFLKNQGALARSSTSPRAGSPAGVVDDPGRASGEPRNDVRLRCRHDRGPRRDPASTHAVLLSQTPGATQMSKAC